MVLTARLGPMVLASALIVSGCSFGSADAGEELPPSGDAVASGANDGVGPAGSGPAPVSVTLGLRVDVDSFDPFGSLGDSGALQAFRFLYDTVVRIAPDGTVLPGAAEGWAVDGAAVTFTIRDGLVCSDGTPLDAEAVGASFRTYGEEGGMGAAALFGPSGMKDVTVDAAARTVRIETNSPYNDMLTGMSSGGFIVCGSGLADRDALRSAPAGSGPYELVSTRAGEHVLKRRDGYTALPIDTAITDLPANVTLTVLGDDATAADLLGQGRVQIAGTQSSMSSFLATDPSLVAIPAAGYGTNAVAFMQSEGAATADDQLRIGMAKLLDSVEGGAAETLGKGISRRTLLTPNLACYTEEAESYAPTYEPLEAGKILNAAGYQIGNMGVRTNPDGSPLVIRVVGNNMQGTAPQFIAEALEAGGFDVDLFVGTYDESIAKLLSDQFDVGIYPYVSSYPAPSSWPNQIGSQSAANFARVSNPEFDEHAATALSVIGDEEQRCAAWHEAERSALSNANVVPFSQPVNHWFGNGVTFNATYFTVDPFSIRSR